MTDQANLDTLIVSNLADLEAAAHHVHEMIEPMLTTEVERIVADFVKHHGWGGEVEGLDTLWVAPPAWADANGNDGDYLCHFALDVVPLAEADTDYFWLSTLTGAGRTTAGLYWASDSVSATKLGRLVADHPDVVARLQQAGFVYDVANKRSLYLPVAIDRETLVAGLKEGAIDEAAEVFNTALNAAAAAVPLFADLVTTIGKE